MSLCSGLSFHSAPLFQDVSFWSVLGQRKLDDYHLDSSERECIGAFTHGAYQQVRRRNSRRGRGRSKLTDSIEED